jgi:putative glutamine amidotransferase
MIKKVILLTGLVVSFPLFAIQTCELPKNEVIKIGCSSDCDFFYRFRLFTTSWAMGYSTKIINLQSNPTALSEVDAILVPGGADIDPKYYLSSVTSELQSYTQENIKLMKRSNEGLRRDPFEYSLVKTYSEDERFKTVPLLGICRGLQMMSVAQGLPLYLDIKTEVGIKNRKNLFDRVRVEGSDSLMSSLYSSPSFLGYKIHHQGIRVPYFLAHQGDYPNVRVTAYSNNQKVAEAIEYTHRPALGVQYHPERSFTGTSAPVFRWFLTKACEHKISKDKI